MINQFIEEEKEDLELSMFKLSKIANAIGNYSFNNKLGKGGFGPIYKVNIPQAISSVIVKISV